MIMGGPSIVIVVIVASSYSSAMFCRLCGKVSEVKGIQGLCKLLLLAGSVAQPPGIMVWHHGRYGSCCSWLTHEAVYGLLA
jgi:hypothetical protein